MSKQQKTSNLIDLQGITKSYQTQGKDVSVLRKIDMTVLRNEMVAIMGPSGSGKSTLLFILGLFLSPTTGKYLVNDTNILELSRGHQAQFRREHIGFVLQGADMFEHSTVYENIEYPLIYAKSKPSLRPERIHQVLEQVNLTHRMHHSSNKLSGGERQRVAIARAIVNKPAVILADEPTGQLDSDNSQQIMECFRSIASSTDTAMILVTHDQNVAEKCDQVLHIENGELLSEK
ncbi:ABC-type antimicrobial peptide transport system, ATPase component [Desulfocapsa sulfexigens DSM 10523]|uniref:ABC-type antimicrobial peptide transport system, ATPase component n=1 Tax=Desulfocapsa sulfexigens (strain DSM 10523 / SB164P1) TaxID=1167006 RepID=M1PA78_DESSD|nr:ABC transporter ATP-binding protein [Desulfocapsa sulfexigens]AGF78537.1 ABC-type antimicrobial peptide transport system, ATPase component [Desulfocapsa sulfexigens DSM 10523]